MRVAYQQQESGFFFLNKYGERITTRGISGQLKKLAVRYNINPAVGVQLYAAIKCDKAGQIVVR